LPALKIGIGAFFSVFAVQGTGGQFACLFFCSSWLLDW
jgi:hypothetical protein